MRKTNVKVSRREKINMPTSFMNKNLHAKISTNKNQHPTSPLIIVSFARRKIYVKALRRENITCNKFREPKSAWENFQE